MVVDILKSCESTKIRKSISDFIMSRGLEEELIDHLIATCENDI